MRTHAVGGGKATEDFNPLPPRAEAQSVRSRAHCLQGVMSSAKAHAVGRVQWIATIATLPDVISEQAMLRRCLRATRAIPCPLAAIAGVTKDLLAPLLMRVGLVMRIGPLGLDRHSASVRFRDERSQDTQTRH